MPHVTLLVEGGRPLAHQARTELRSFMKDGAH